MTPDVTRTDPDGIDYGWVMQVTFVLTIVVGAPVVAVASLFTSVPTWADRAIFAIRVGAVVWLITGISVFLYARSYRSGNDGSADDTVEPSDAGEAGSE